MLEILNIYNVNLPSPNKAEAHNEHTHIVAAVFDFYLVTLFKLQRMAVIFYVYSWPIVHPIVFRA